jgi:hypothetical protein
MTAKYTSWDVTLDGSPALATENCRFLPNDSGATVLDLMGPDPSLELSLEWDTSLNTATGTDTIDSGPSNNPFSFVESTTLQTEYRVTGQIVTPEPATAPTAFMAMLILMGATLTSFRTRPRVLRQVFQFRQLSGQ